MPLSDAKVKRFILAKLYIFFLSDILCKHTIVMYQISSIPSCVTGKGKSIPQGVARDRSRASA
jgi:hypothetical protein